MSLSKAPRRVYADTVPLKTAPEAGKDFGI